MTRLRQTIARRLKEAQNTAAMLTTFNEVDMSAVMHMRNQYKDLFEKRHGVKLGFMGFFVRACVAALKEIPAVNAEIDGTDLIYKNYYHIGVAVGTEKGLVVPVVRDADHKSLAEIEKTIADFGRRARDGALKIEEMQGGTFTISNGGVYGSLMSTPILNAPQSGILGMHKIQERPVAVAGKIEIRPMMYLALSYDHRIVDGREAVTFLVRVKDVLEDPARLVLDLVVFVIAGPSRATSRAIQSSVTSMDARSSPAMTMRVRSVCHVLRSHRHRHRPRRLCLRDPRGAARHEGRGGREARDPRRHLPQRRLHPVEGAAARLRNVRGGRALLRQDGHRRRHAEARSRRDDEVQGRRRRRQRQGRRVPAQEEQDRCRARHRPHRRRPARSR